MTLFDRKWTFPTDNDRCTTWNGPFWDDHCKWLKPSFQQKVTNPTFDWKWSFMTDLKRPLFPILHKDPLVSYHKDGSKKLNACSLWIFCMVYLNTEFSYYLQNIYYSIYMLGNAHFSPPSFSLLIPLFLTWRTSFFCSWRKYPSTLVPGLLTAHPLLVHPSLHTPHIKLQYLHRRHQQRQPSSSGTPLSDWKWPHAFHAAGNIHTHNDQTYMIKIIWSQKTLFS
jgi:hypothetical protein